MLGNSSAVGEGLVEHREWARHNFFSSTFQARCQLSCCTRLVQELPLTYWQPAFLRRFHRWINSESNLPVVAKQQDCLMTSKARWKTLHFRAAPIFSWADSSPTRPVEPEIRRRSAESISNAATFRMDDPAFRVSKTGRAVSTLRYQMGFSRVIPFRVFLRLTSSGVHHDQTSALASCSRLATKRCDFRPPLHLLILPYGTYRPYRLYRLLALRATRDNFQPQKSTQRGPQWPDLVERARS